MWGIFKCQHKKKRLAQVQPFMANLYNQHIRKRWSAITNSYDVQNGSLNRHEEYIGEIRLKVNKKNKTNPFSWRIAVLDFNRKAKRIRFRGESRFWISIAKPNESVFMANHGFGFQSQSQNKTGHKLLRLWPAMLFSFTTTTIRLNRSNVKLIYHYPDVNNCFYRA